MSIFRDRFGFQEKSYSDHNESDEEHPSKNEKKVFQNWISNITMSDEI